jgi:electron transport complex protein RnfC
MGLLQRLTRASFSHGIHPAEHKAETRDKAIRRLPFAPRLVVPLAQHIGKPAVPLVHVGQEVLRGELIAHADGFLSVPLHAPASGVVEAIELRPTARGDKGMAIVIRVYQGDSQAVAGGMPQNLSAMTPEALIEVVQQSGLAGLGGGTFPSHAKLKIPEGFAIDTLLANGCECEPYLTTDHRVMLEHADDLLRGVRIAMRACGAPRAIIGIEDNKLDALAKVKAAIRPGEPIEARAVKTKYPQGAEKILLKSLLGREVPSGGQIFQTGACMLNVGTLAAIGKLLPRGEGLIERVITVAGPGVKQPGNYRVPLGTPVGFILEQLGFNGTAAEVILGGPMMGQAVASLEVPVTKGTSGLLVMNEAYLNQPQRKSQPCIKCGECVNACPMHLNPKELGLLAAKGEYEKMAEEFHLNDCFECGCCSFVCPSAIPLVQQFRVAKAANRGRAA